MSEQQDANIATALALLAALEAGTTGADLARFYHQDAVQIEYPNLLNPHGGRSDLTRLLERAATVPDLLQTQHYEVRSATAAGDAVALETRWTGELARPIGTLPAGATMTADIAIFFTFADGRITSQRNYDCFAPW